MKKIFIEPEVVRIEMKMSENIASSGPHTHKIWEVYGYQHPAGFLLAKVIDTGGVPCIKVIVETEFDFSPDMDSLFVDANLGTIWSKGCI